MKIFISQPMRNKTPKEIWVEREDIINELQKEYKDFEIIDSFKEEFKDLNPVQALGKSIELLADADIAVFAKGWNLTNGCTIEHQVCQLYGIEVKEI